MAKVKKGTILNTGRTWFKKGFTPWNKGKGGYNFGGFVKRKCLNCCNEFDFERWRIKDSARGKFCSHSCRAKYHKGKLGYNWRNGKFVGKGGVPRGKEYRIWVISVKERDNYKCIWCGSIEQLEADHIRPWLEYPELRFAIDNGRTLCHKCHSTTDSYGGRRKIKYG